jgi:hypothetical protein
MTDDLFIAACLRDGKVLLLLYILECVVRFVVNIILFHLNDAITITNHYGEKNLRRETYTKICRTIDWYYMNNRLARGHAVRLQQTPYEGMPRCSGPWTCHQEGVGCTASASCSIPMTMPLIVWPSFPCEGQSPRPPAARFPQAFAWSSSLGGGPALQTPDGSLRRAVRVKRTPYGGSGLLSPGGVWGGRGGPPGRHIRSFCRIRRRTKAYTRNRGFQLLRGIIFRARINNFAKFEFFPLFSAKFELFPARINYFPLPFVCLRMPRLMTTSVG